jgi:hypothetical protein
MHDLVVPDYVTQRKDEQSIKATKAAKKRKVARERDMRETSASMASTPR